MATVAHYRNRSILKGYPKLINPSTLKRSGRSGETWEGLGRRSGGYLGFRSRGLRTAWGSAGAEGDCRMLHFNECEACRSS